jgi:hypothetical protein
MRRGMCFSVDPEARNTRITSVQGFAAWSLIATQNRCPIGMLL